MKKRLIIIVSIFVALLAVATALFFLFFKNEPEWITVKEPTCEEGGEKQRTNSKGEVETQAIPPLGHDSTVTTAGATCTKDGFNIYTCSRCSKTYISDFVAATGHSYGTQEIKKAATCTESGTAESICASCGHVKKTSINPLGHAYVAISNESVANETKILHRCDLCTRELLLDEDASSFDSLEKDFAFDLPTSFAFDILTEKDELFILSNLKIIDAYYDDSEYESNNEVIIPYTLKNIEKNVWRVFPVNAYEFDTTYIAKISKDIQFKDYVGQKLTFTIQSDENHENSYEYQSNIVFLQALENSDSGYSPKLMSSSEASENYYLSVKKTDGLQIGSILCVGEATSMETLDPSSNCFFGKIEQIYPMLNDEWMLVMSEPELTEIFADLDISVEKMVNLESAETVEQIENHMIDALYTSDDFVMFLGTVNTATVKYLSANNFDITPIADIQSFMDRIELSPVISVDNSKLNVKVTGNINIPLKIKNTSVGSIDIGFVVDLTASFLIDVNYKLKDSRFNSQKIEYLDLKITQTDTVGFQFTVSMNIDYSLEEGLYIENTDSKKIHRRGCVHLSNVKDKSKLKSISASEAEEKLSKRPELQCKQCKPVDGFHKELLVLNKDTKVIHAYDCLYTKQMSEKNKLTSNQNASYWLSQGYSCCDWCHPQNRDQKIYETYLIDSLAYSDWQQVATDISQWASEAGIQERAEKGVALFPSLNIPVYGPIQVQFNIRFVLSLKIEASVSYEYTYTQTSHYGFRFQHNGITPFSTKSASVTKNDITIIGQLEVKVGLLVDFNINISGLERWARIGLTVEIGAYTNLNGISNHAPDGGYQAAYFEAGIYVDIDIYYDLIIWSDDATVSSLKYPIIRLGYGKAYFDYVEMKESLDIYGTYPLSGILKVKYLDLRAMKTMEETLNANGKTDVYTINYSFANGNKFYVKDGKIVASEDITCQDVDTLTITVTGHSQWDNYQKNSSVFYLKEYVIKLTAYNMHDYVNGVCATCMLSMNDDKDHVCLPTPIGTELKPTCESTGLTAGSACLICDKILEDREEIAIDENNHVGEPSTSMEIPPTCKDNGYIIEIYSGCGHEVKTLDRIPDYHNHTDYVKNEAGDMVAVSLLVDVAPPKEPTCTEVGWEFHQKCSHCGNEQYKEIPALGHNLVGGTCTNCNTSFPASQGFEFVSNGDGTCKIHRIGSCTDKQLVFPEYAPSGERVVAIGERAFYWNNSNIESVIIPGSISVIEYKAFYGCSNLKSVSLGNGITSIGEWAFNDCRIQSITIPGTVQTVGDFAFSDCYSMTSVKMCEGVKEFGWAFNECDKLKTVFIPDSVTEFADDAFSDCNKLTYAAIGKGVTAIGDRAFQSCDIQTLIIPDSVKSIGDKAFEECTDLTSVIIGDGVETIGENAFYHCYNIRELQLGSNIKTIGGAAFRECYSIRSVTLPDGLVTLDGWAFMDTGIGSVTIPDSVTEIGEAVFDGCERLETVVIGAGITEITDLMFCDCNLKQLELPSHITRIGIQAFSGCKSLEKIKIPEAVTFIGTYAFSGCESLIEIRLPSQIETIEKNTFICCKGLTEIELPEGVVSIGGGAFQSCESLRSIYLPTSLKTIGKEAFQYCYELTSIYIPSQVTSIEASTFSQCGKLTAVTFAGELEFIGDSAFWGCENLVSIHLPNSITTIERQAFRNCNKLTGIILPNSLTKIQKDSFGYNLSYMVIPTSVKTIENISLFFGESASNVFYCGTQAQWEEINYSPDHFEAVSIYYYSEEAPSAAGLYWHYVNGEPTPW